MLLNVIRRLVPNAEYAQYGDDPKNETEYNARVVWLDSRPQPSWADIEAISASVEATERLAEIETQRRAAYTNESDPLFFEWQRGEGTEQAWRDKVEEIRQRYPYPT